MFSIGPLGFVTPWLLVPLVALPILWILLRAVPPAPIRRRFPGVALLLGLKDDEAETDKTPWWLLLIRTLALAAVIIGFAGPVLNPEVRVEGSGPLLVVMDGSWADARDWPQRVAKAEALVADAGAAGRPVALIRLTDAPDAVEFQTAEAWASRVAGVQPQPWAPSDFTGWAGVLPEGKFDSVWLSDGLAHPDREDLISALQDRGTLRVVETTRAILALHPARFEDGKVVVAVSRLPAADASSVEVQAMGPDPAGIERVLGKATVEFAPGAARAEAKLDLPPEVRNRITRFELAPARTAGAVSLSDDSLKRRKIALIRMGPEEEGLQLLSPLHYLRQALQPVAEIIEGNLIDSLRANPDVVLLADVADLTQAEQDAALEWVQKGGLLLRFAGPQLAASDISRTTEDPLMPVRLREGGRSVGGAMSWGEPKGLAPFAEGSPFYGLQPPKDVVVRQQVLAQPDPDLAERTIAALEDGTPLMTRKVIGAGQVVLVHVTANAEWSTLPLSGLFVQMLERLAVSTKPTQPEAADLAGQVWVPQVVLDAFGRTTDAGELPGVEGEALSGAITSGPTVALQPGLYAGADRRVALNVISDKTELLATDWPASVPVETLEGRVAQVLKGAFLTGALILLLVDVLAALWLAGRLRGMMRGTAAALVLALGVATLPAPSRAQEATALPDDARALEATTAVVLAYVMTGDPKVDEMSRAGLLGLSDKLWQRTSIEPMMPIGVDIEKDELAFYPFLYWPILPAGKQPSDAAYAKLNQYLRTGGMILFDTRDADVSGFGGTTPEGQTLQLIASGLDIPALEPLPPDHVLTRTFYLLQDFPGRHVGGTVWVEAAPMAVEAKEGMPFRNLNDGVTPVVIGGNDWASAWATDDYGVALVPIGRGAAGEQQREIAYRFGVNLIMYVLTGNYKSDQVHVPALLERLGQ